MSLGSLKDHPLEKTTYTEGSADDVSILFQPYWPWYLMCVLAYEVVVWIFI